MPNILNAVVPGSGNDPVTIFLISAFLVVVGFLVIREILTWYWKINRIVDLLEKIEFNTRKAGTKGEVVSSDKQTNLN